MSSRHLGQYKGNFYIIDEVLIANLSPAKAPVTRMGFQIVLFSYPCVFKYIQFGLRFDNRLHREKEMKTQRYHKGT